MSTPYFRPASIVQEELESLPSGDIRPQPCCIVGPHMKVLAVDDTEDRLLINYGAYDPSTDVTYDYAALPVGGRVKTSTVKLFMEDILAKYATLSGSNVIERGSQPNYINIPTAAGFQDYTNAAGTVFNRNTVFKQRDVKIGDRVKVTSGSIVLNSRITGFINDVIDAAVSAPIATSNPATVSYSGSVVETDDQGTDHLPTIYTGSTTYKGDITKGVINDVYALECIVAGAPGTAKFKVTSDTGDNVASVTSVAFGTAFNVGTRGLQAKIASTGNQAFIVGEIYTFTVQAAYTRSAPTLISAASDYTGKFDTVYKIEVVKGGLWADSPQVVVTSSNGIDSYPSQVVDYNVTFNVGTLGVTVKFASNLSSAQGGLVLGDVYYVTAAAAQKGAVRTIIISNPLDSSIVAGDDLSVDFLIYKKSMEIPSNGYPHFSDESFVATADNFTINAGIKIQDPTWLENDGVTLADLTVEAATLFVPYTALLTAEANILKSLSDLSSVPAVLGKATVANPIGLGVQKALENSGGQPVYWVAVQSDDLEGYQIALQELEKNPTPYFRVPLSSDEAILDLIQGHVSSEASDETGHRCMGVVATGLSTVVTKYGAKGTGENWTGYVAVEPGSSPATYTRVTVPGALFVTDGIRAGDEFRTNFGVDAYGNDTWGSKLVNEVIDEENLVLASGYDSAVGDVDHLQRIQIVRTLTKDEQADLAAAQSTAFSSRRTCNVLCDIPMDIPWYFAAAALAGLASSVVPHQPITNYTLNGFNDQVGPYRRFTPTQLDRIAAGGTLIVTQDVAQGQVYVRHQLTTDRTDDRHAELSITRNIDSVADYIDQGLKPIVGKYNFSEYLQQLLDVTCRQRLDYLVANRVTPSAGPQLVAWDQKSLLIAQNPVAKTQVDLEVDADFPYPANRLKFKLRVKA